jgi:tRNA (guanine-N(7)-)-methyltransferase subunit TRM82
MPEIHAFDFNKPVVDFTVTSDGLIWVCLDGQWSETGVDDLAESAPAMVRVLRLSADKVCFHVHYSFPFLSRPDPLITAH